MDADTEAQAVSAIAQRAAGLHVNQADVDSIIEVLADTQARLAAHVADQRARVEAAAFDGLPTFQLGRY
jgi:hypothetical protein